MRTLVLASNSPRRRELIRLLGLPVVDHAADIDESQQIGESPLEYVRRMAVEKAAVIAEGEQQPALVIGADTIVLDDGILLGKPADASEARQMLLQLRGRQHQVYTSTAIIETHTGQSYDTICHTDVPMRHYSDLEIEAYIATGDPLDKAGAYGIQHPGFHPVDDLNGCFASVMGLPLCHLLVGLNDFIDQLPQGLPTRCQAFLNFDCPVFGSILGAVQEFADDV